MTRQFRRLAATGEPVRELAEAFGIGRATAYRYLREVSHRFLPRTKAGPGRSLKTCRDAAHVRGSGPVRAERNVVDVG